MPESKRVRGGHGGAAATVAACHLAILALLVTPGPGPAECSGGARVRRSDDYDNMDNFLMGSNDYDNFFLKTAKSVPRIGRRDGSSEPLHVDRRSVDMNELVPNTGGYDHFFLKASKSVPRIGKRNDEFFMKTAKSVPRIGRRSGDGPDNFLLKGRLPSDYLKTSAIHRLDRRSRLEVEESEPIVRDNPGGSDGLVEPRHRVQRSGDSPSTFLRLAKRVHPALNEVGDYGTDSQWPWFRQQESSPGPYKRANPADSINLEDLPWGRVDTLLRSLERQRLGAAYRAAMGQDDDHHPDVILLRQETPADSGNKWHYGVDIVSSAENNNNNRSASEGSKELEEQRYQPDVK